MCGEGDHDHDNGDNHDYCWSYVWGGGLLCEENKFWHLHYQLNVSGEILQVKFWQNILWILIIIAAQESETRPLDFTETMQRPALTSVSVNLNRGGSKGFDNTEGAEGALTYVSPTLNIVFLHLVIMCGKRVGRECKRTYIYLTHQSLNEWMPARNQMNALETAVAICQTCPPYLLTIVSKRDSNCSFFNRKEGEMNH